MPTVLDLDVSCRDECWSPCDLSLDGSTERANKTSQIHFVCTRMCCFAWPNVEVFASMPAGRRSFYLVLQL